MVFAAKEAAFGPPFHFCHEKGAMGPNFDFPEILD